jgi:hypothetical protein
MRSYLVAALLLAAPLAVVPPAIAQTPAVAAQRTPSPPGAELYVISPKNRATVHSPVLVQFGLKGMGVAPLPATDKVVHFGKGQTETTVTLTPGKHTLQVLLADQNHVPHQPPVISKKITITVAQ